MSLTQDSMHMLRIDTWSLYNPFFSRYELYLSGIRIGALIGHNSVSLIDLAVPVVFHVNLAKVASGESRRIFLVVRARVVQLLYTEPWDGMMESREARWRCGRNRDYGAKRREGDVKESQSRRNCQIIGSYLFLMKPTERRPGSTMAISAYESTASS